MGDLALPTLLLAAGLFFLVVELFIPSGGLLAILSASSLIASIVTAFLAGGLTLGLIYIGIIGVALPALLFAAVKFWPNTPLGRLILVSPPEHPDDVLPDSEEYQRIQSLIGLQGVAQTAMLPAGGVLIEGKVYDAVSRGEAIEQGDLVQVSEVSGNRITVRKIGAEAAELPTPKEMPSPSLPESKTMIEDPFEDPLA